MARTARPPAANPATDAIEPLGTVRRSQLISTYGIGSIVDLEKGSFMPMGLEDWDRVTRLPSLTIGEPRLQAMLGVDHFRLGPVAQQIQGSRNVSARSAAPAARFPAWHECPRCHRIGTESAPFELDADGSRLRCNAHGGVTVHTSPVRFVVACESGHIDDFPWAWWAHRSRDAGVCANPVLYLGSLGRSAALADLYVACRTCGTEAAPVRESLGSAFGGQTFAANRCSGNRPWLGDRGGGCSKRVRAIQRGASNVHFPVVCSALSIPPGSDAVNQILEELREVLEGVPEASLENVLQGYARRYQIDPAVLLHAWRRMLADEQGRTNQTERISRIEEYNALSEDREDPVVGGIVPQFRNHVGPPPPELSRWFDLVGAASRLREVRALAGFSRIEPYPVAAERVQEAITQGHISPLSKYPKNWLPGAEIRGEGIFLRFRTDAIDSWIGGNPAVLTRSADLDARSAEVATRRGYVRDYTVTPRLLLVHSFSHALMRQISVECGYSTSALRERLFISERTDEGPAMNGVLVYTGSPDSEGSLGGLVRLAAPELLGPIVMRTLAAAGWCGSDPVCLETSPAQAGERISGAACHCCLLAPETACEKFNRELDRAIMVGEAEGAFQGFFGPRTD